MKKKQVIAAIGLILLFVEWHIDFSVGMLDTALLVLATLLAVVFSFVSALAALVSRRREKAVLSAVICAAAISGNLIGLEISQRQLQDAKAHVQMLAEEIQAEKDRQGRYPEKLAGLSPHDPSGYVPMGFLRKRPLHYAVWEAGGGFTLWFPYKAFMVARYEGPSGQWTVRD